MPAIRMRTDSAGPVGNRYAGQVYPVAPEEGAELVRGGFAEWVEAPKREALPIEAAVQPKRETAARTKPPIRKRK